jgi:hypothetical protein
MEEKEAEDLIGQRLTVALAHYESLRRRYLALAAVLAWPGCSMRFGRTVNASRTLA